MSFQLGITFEDVEVKGIKIDLKNFLFLNARICKEIENLCRYNSYVNFAETLLNGIQIEGKIETVFNHKRFINFKFFSHRFQLERILQTFPE